MQDLRGKNRTEAAAGEMKLFRKASCYGDEALLHCGGHGPSQPGELLLG